MSSIDIIEDDSSNDVIAMELDYIPERSLDSAATKGHSEGLLKDKPLKHFFKRLILNNASQNTILTNSQIEEILRKEFNFNLISLHPLELDIYVSVVKKYLKAWPMWDEVEATTKALLAKGKYNKSFMQDFEKKYQCLKTFLNAQLDLARELSLEEVTKLKNAEKDKSKAVSSVEESKNPDASNVVLEIKATRGQLNTLIYQQPNAEFCNTIFNVNAKAPSHIRMNTFSLEAILNWWSVKITISLQANNPFITRETTHELNHLLVNRKVKATRKTKPECLNENIQFKETKKAKPILKSQVLECLDLLSTDHDAAMEGMDVIIKIVKRDFERFGQVVGVPVQYRRYLNKHPYIRYLYAEVENVNLTDKAKYDIQLQETISPMHQFLVGRVDLSNETALPAQWLKVECVVCGVIFTDERLSTKLRQHFDEYHQEEPDWQCTNCQKSFTMLSLAENWWSHAC